MHKQTDIPEILDTSNSPPYPIFPSCPFVVASSSSIPRAGQRGFRIGGSNTQLIPCAVALVEGPRKPWHSVADVTSMTRIALPSESRDAEPCSLALFRGYAMLRYAMLCFAMLRFAVI